MLKYILTLGSLFFFVQANAQPYIMDRISGRPITATVYDDIRGSAWLFEDWKTSNVTDRTGTTHLNVQVRFDLYANKLFYNYNNTVYEFVTDISEVDLFTLAPGDTTNMIRLKRGFTLSDVVTPSKFVQVLAEGKVSFLKYVYKSLDETTEYNVPGKIKTFNNRSTFFYVKDGKVLSQKPSAKILEELTGDKWAAVETYMKQNSLSAKNEADFARAARYYNTL